MLIFLSIWFRAAELILLLLVVAVVVDSLILYSSSGRIFEARRITGGRFSLWR